MLIRMIVRATHSRRHRLVGLAIVAAILGTAFAAFRFRVPDTPAERALAAASAAAIGATGQKSVLGAKTTSREQKAIPARISIPAIGVNARVIRLGLNRDRTIGVPTNFADTGWFQPGPEPGETGAAVIVGHVASRRGPAVFHRLRELRVGKVITIHLQDRSTVRFVVRSMTRVPKSRFPTRRVYARTKQPTLRLVTCAGPLNWSTGRHPDNYIVFATLVR